MARAKRAARRKRPAATDVEKIETLPSVRVTATPDVVAVVRQELARALREVFPSLARRPDISDRDAQIAGLIAKNDQINKRVEAALDLIEGTPEAKPRDPIAGRVELGDLARDRITGFEGIVTAQTRYIDNCDRFTLQPRGKNAGGQTIMAQSFDISNVQLLQKAVVKPQPQAQQTGGPEPREVFEPSAPFFLGGCL